MPFGVSQAILMFFVIILSQIVSNRFRSKVRLSSSKNMVFTRYLLVTCSMWFTT